MTYKKKMDEASKLALDNNKEESAVLFLMEEVSGYQTGELYFHQNDKMPNNQIDKFDELVKKYIFEKEEEAVVQTYSIDKNGKQIGSPVNHTLRRVGNGRWYITAYENRF